MAWRWTTCPLSSWPRTWTEVKEGRVVTYTREFSFDPSMCEACCRSRHKRYAADYARFVREFGTEAAGPPDGCVSHANACRSGQVITSEAWGSQATGTG